MRFKTYFVLPIVFCTLAFGGQDHTCQGGHNCNGPSGDANGPSTVNNGGAGGNATGGAGGSGGDSSAISGSTATSTSVAGASSNQTQGQGQSQSADNAGNAQSTTFNQNQVRQAPMAYAPDAFPSAPCRVAGSAGLSAPIGGISLGGSKLDKDCSRRETARSFMNLGLPDAACKILLSTKDAKEAGLTQADCVVPTKPTTLVLPEVQPTLDPHMAQ